MLFKAGLGLVFLAAFLSAAVQVEGLIGARGLLPLAEHLERYRAAVPGLAGRLHDFPTLLWFDHSDGAIAALTMAGAALSLLMIAGIGGRAVAFLLWLLYLSCVTAGRDFFFYQWDNLLLETSLLAIALPGGGTIGRWVRRKALPEPSPVAVLLMKWVLFRLLVESALAKILYGAEDWLTLRAMTYYYETAPLPSWGGWLVQQFPLWFHQACVFFTFLCELVLPMVVFARSRALRLSFFAFNAGFQTMIALTSNYGWFNLLSIVLGLIVLDDSDIDAAARLFVKMRRRSRPGAEPGPGPASGPTEAPALQVPAVVPAGRPGPWLRAGQIISWALASLLTAATLLETLPFFVRDPELNRWIAAVRKIYEPFRSINVYHLFPGVLRERIVAEFEGSRDGIDWIPYHLRYAPGDPKESPPMTWLHNPRFPFTYSFLTLGRGGRDSEYIGNLIQRLCCDPQAVARMIENNPFLDQGPSTLRVSYYRYRFGTWSDLDRTGEYWLREQVRPPSRPITCSCPPPPVRP